MFHKSPSPFLLFLGTGGVAEPLSLLLRPEKLCSALFLVAATKTRGSGVLRFWASSLGFAYHSNDFLLHLVECSVHRMHFANSHWINKFTLKVYADKFLKSYS